MEGPPIKHEDCLFFCCVSETGCVCKDDREDATTSTPFTLDALRQAHTSGWLSTKVNNRRYTEVGRSLGVARHNTHQHNINHKHMHIGRSNLVYGPFNSSFFQATRTFPEFPPPPLIVRRLFTDLDGVSLVSISFFSHPFSPPLLPPPTSPLPCSAMLSFFSSIFQVLFHLHKSFRPTFFLLLSRFVFRATGFLTLLEVSQLAFPFFCPWSCTSYAVWCTSTGLNFQHIACNKSVTVHCCRFFFASRARASICFTILSSLAFLLFQPTMSMTFPTRLFTPAPLSTSVMFLPFHALCNPVLRAVSCRCNKMQCLLPFFVIIYNHWIFPIF